MKWIKDEIKTGRQNIHACMHRSLGGINHLEGLLLELIHVAKRPQPV